MIWKPNDPQREIRDACRAKGICVFCKKRIAIHSFCGVCLERRAEVQARRKARWVAEGNCSRCGRSRDREDRKMCKKCRKYMTRVKRIQAAA